MEFYRYYLENLVDGDFGLRLETYVLHKETPCGYWIKYKGRNKAWKWIAKGARASYAYPDKKSAKRNFIARTKKSIFYNERNLAKANWGLKHIENFDV